MKPDIRKYASDPLAFIDALVVPSAHGPRRFGEIMADFQREWFNGIAPSLIAVASGKAPPIGRFWTERTKGASKDSDCACVLLWLLAFSPVKLDMQVGAADRDQALELKKAASDILRLNDWLSQRIEIQAWSLLCRATGSECSILASDVASSHGARPDVVVLNELSHITKEEFAQNLLDNASKKPQGLVICATNSGHTGSWQHSWRETFRRSDRWQFHAYSQPAPWLSEAEVEEAERRNSRARFQRLYWGEWVSQSGDALDQADIDASVDSTLTPMGPEPGWSFVAGLDLGIKHDHSALAVVGYRQDSQDLRLAYAESWAPNPKTRQVDLIKVEDTVLAMHKRFDFVTVGFDPYAAQLMAQRLQRQHVPMEEVAFVGANLNKMASTLLDVFRSRRLRMYPCRKLIADLGRLTIAERSYGYKLEAVHDEHGHADLATALAIALPIAIEQCDRPQVVLGAGWQCLTAQDEYESPLDAFARRVADAYRRDREDLERSRGNEDEAMLMPSHPGAFVKPSGPRDAPRPSPFDFPTFQQ